MLNHAKRIAPLFVEPNDRITDGIEERAVDPRADFIKKHDPRVHHHRAAQFKQFFLSTGEVASFLITQMIDG